MEQSTSVEMIPQIKRLIKELEAEKRKDRELTLDNMELKKTLSRSDIEKKVANREIKATNGR